MSLLINEDNNFSGCRKIHSLTQNYYIKSFTHMLRILYDLFKKFHNKICV